MGEWGTAKLTCWGRKGACGARVIRRVSGT